jgi:hypothetical protein
MAAGDQNVSKVIVEVVHSPDIDSSKVVSGSRTAGIHYDPWRFVFPGLDHAGKKCFEFETSMAAAGTTTTLTAWAGITSLLLRNQGAYDVEAVWYEVKGKKADDTAIGSLVIVVDGVDALDVLGHASIDLDSSPYYAKAGDFIYLKAAEDAANYSAAWPIASVAASAGTSQIALGGISLVTANADDDSVIPIILSKVAMVIPANGGLVLAKNVFPTLGVKCYGRGGASIVHGCLFGTTV